MSRKPFVESLSALLSQAGISAEVDRLDWPNSKNEEWKFNDVNPLMKTELTRPNVASKLPAEFVPMVTDAHKMVFLNGKFQSQLSSVSADGVTISVQNRPLNRWKDDSFASAAALNNPETVVISVDKNVVVEKPIYVSHVVHDVEKGAFVTPRLFVDAGKNSKLILVEDFSDLKTPSYVQVGQTGMKLAEQSHVVHVRVQRQNAESFWLGRVESDLKRDSHYDSYAVVIGAAYSRNDVYALQVDPSIQCTLDGLVMISGNQFADTHTTMDHAMPHGESHQLHKVILLNKSHSVFNGKIFVRKDAQKTNSFQENRTMLLSQSATVNTKPQLEIFADDVKCSHGATVGQVEDESLFYLKSRGLNEIAARKLLVAAFAGEVIAKIPVPEVAAFLQEFVNRFVPNFSKETV